MTLTRINTAHADQRALELSGGAAAIGVPVERVDPSTLQAVDRLFPAPTSGLTFLALVLRLAMVKQLALAHMGRADVAEISVQSIRALAKSIGWSYETTHKYVVLFCALGLLVKVREDGRVKLRFPLCRYQPPTSLKILDKLIAEARPKVVSCAKKVRKRFLLLYGQHLSTPIDSPPSLSLAAPRPAFEIAEALADLRQVLTLPEAAALRERLAAILAKLERAERRLAAETSTLALSPEAQIGRLSEETVDSLTAGARENGRLAQQTVDSLTNGTEENGRLAGKRVDSLAAHSPLATRKFGRLSQKTVDSPAPEGNDDGRLGTQKSTPFPVPNTQTGRLSTKTVDSVAKVVDSEPEALSNVNVILKTFLGSVNVNVRTVVDFLLAVFHEEPTKRGYYYNLYKTHANPDAWCAAAIETLVGLHLTKTVRSPGKYFYDRCVQLHEAIPPETAALVELYGGLTLPQLLEKWRQPSPQAANTVSKLGGPAVRESRRQPLTLRLPRDRKMPGMSLDELKVLLQELHGHPDTCGWRTQPYHQDDGSCALLVENVLQRQRWIYSFREWQENVVSLFPPRLTHTGIKNLKSQRKISSLEYEERKRK